MLPQEPRCMPIAAAAYTRRRTRAAASLASRYGWYAMRQCLYRASRFERRAIDYRLMRADVCYALCAAAARLR